MEEKLSALMEILEEERDSFQILLEIAEDKKEKIIENEVEVLKEKVEKENDVISQLEDLEERRVDLVEELSAELGIEGDEIKYSRLIEELPGAWKEKLQPLRQELLSTIDEVHSQNQQNKMLIQEALKLNNFSMHVFTKIMDSDIYNDKGAAKNNASRHIIDRRG
ncbi:MAG: flagellar protein FlgN [Bacillota bacterium]